MNTKNATTEKLKGQIYSVRHSPKKKKKYIFGAPVKTLIEVKVKECASQPCVWA